VLSLLFPKSPEEPARFNVDGMTERGELTYLIRLWIQASVHGGVEVGRS
jgi:hypothetical protein